jgi:hypothetical protein
MQAFDANGCRPDIYSPNAFGLTEGGRRFSAQLAVDIYL